MWIFPTKKELKKEIKKINAAEKKLRERIENNSLKIATLQGSYLILAKYQAKSQNSLKQVSKQSQSNYNNKMMEIIKKSKKALIMAKIIELIENHSVIDTFEIIVKEKKLCSKATFYRYISSLKSQNLVSKDETEAKVRLK